MVMLSCCGSEFYAHRTKTNKRWYAICPTSKSHGSLPSRVVTVMIGPFSTPWWEDGFSCLLTAAWTRHRIARRRKVLQRPTGGSLAWRTTWSVKSAWVKPLGFMIQMVWRVNLHKYWLWGCSHLILNTWHLVRLLFFFENRVNTP